MRSGVLPFLVLVVLGCNARRDVVTLPGPDGASDTEAGPDGSVACVNASDCPGLVTPCPDRNFCNCGTYKTCESGRCLSFSNDSCAFDAEVWPDANVHTDARPPADSGAPLDAGSCTSARDCTGPTTETLPFCDLLGPPVWSCIGGWTSQPSTGGTCVTECSTARTCTRDDGFQCTTCLSEPTGAATQACHTQQCVLIQLGLAWRVESATCETFPGTTRSFVGAQLSMEGRSNCAFLIRDVATGGDFGTFFEFGTQTFLGFVTDFGGFCGGTWLPTDVPRMLFSCPSCQFVLSP